MYAVAKAVSPQAIIPSVQQALSNPYSTVPQMNQAMGYAAYSQSGRHLLALSQIAGLVETNASSWLRPTQTGRQLLRLFPSRPEALWTVLMALPGYRSSLEYQLLWLLLSNQRRTPILGGQVEHAIFTKLPAFSMRSAHLMKLLHLEGQSLEVIRACLEHTPSPERIAPAALNDLAFAHGMAGGKSDLTRAAEIAAVLAGCAQQPLRIDSAWLSRNQLLALVLLAAARQHEQGVMISVSENTLLSQTICELQNSGIDIRIEQRGSVQAAALIPPVALYINDWTKFRVQSGPMEKHTARSASLEHGPIDIVEQLLGDHLHTRAIPGADGQRRQKLLFEDLIELFSLHMPTGLGEFVTHSAVDAMPPGVSTLTIGGSLPLASDLLQKAQPYRFLREAVQAQRRQAQPGIAILLSHWLLKQDDSPEQLLTLNPHLALLYLVVADSGGLAELLKEREGCWYLDGQPLIAALDSWLRVLGYEVWDEGYSGHEEIIHEFGRLLIEQGMRCRVLERGQERHTPLEASSAYGYYDAAELLNTSLSGRSRR